MVGGNEDQRDDDDVFEEIVVALEAGSPEVCTVKGCGVESVVLSSSAVYTA